MEMTMVMKIRECRVKMGMTQEELAEAIYTKKCTISAYETGKIDIKVSIPIFTLHSLIFIPIVISIRAG